jgi:hypothetical protein
MTGNMAGNGRKDKILMHSHLHLNTNKTDTAYAMKDALSDSKRAPFEGRKAAFYASKGCLTDQKTMGFGLFLTALQLTKVKQKHIRTERH